MQEFKSIIMNTKTLRLELLHTAELHKEGKRCTLIHGNSAFAIGELLYQVIYEIQGKRGLKEVCTNISEQVGYENKEELEALIEENLINLCDKIESKDGESSKYIYGQISLIKTDHILVFAQYLKHFFSPAFLVLITLCFAGAFSYHYNYLPTSVSFSDLTVPQIFGMYSIITCIVFFHELGHAAGALRYGIRPKEIGFGFYLIFPVLFTNITTIWALNKYKRVVINFAGILFQMLVHVFLVLGIVFIPQQADVFQMVIRVNFVLMIYSLTPFFRNDGYWIYCDLFDIPNMMQKAYAYPTNMFKGLFYNTKEFVEGFARNWKKELPLLIFSYGNYVFLGWFIITYGKHLTDITSQLYAYHINDCTSCLTASPFSIGFAYVLLSIMLVHYRKTLAALFIRIRSQFIQ